LLAQYLLKHPQITGVYYPGLPGSHGFDVQKQQARGAGAVLSFTTGSFDLSRRIAENAKLFRISVSFGSVHSTISLPGSMSHASVPPELQATRELTCDLVRISAGIEDVDDLVADLDEAIELSNHALTSESVGLGADK
jgi:cysteine-S-conjugate beta-lyase